MKTVKFSIIIALMSAIICGCSKKSATPPHLLAVPENAAVVLSFNAKQIADKAGLNKLEQYKFYSLMLQEIEDAPAEEKKIIKDFLKDTRTSGLNLDNIFIYGGRTHESDYGFFGITFLIDNVKTFEKLLADHNFGDNINDRVIHFRGTNMQWNDEILVISSDDTDIYIDLFNKDESKSILANELFKSEYSDKHDAYLYCEYNFLINIEEMMSYYSDYGADQASLSGLDLYKDLLLSASLNAEKGEFVAKCKMLPADKVNEILGKFYKTDFNSELYKYFPDQSLFALKFAIKPLDMYNYYKKVIGMGNNETSETATENVEILDEHGNVVEEEEVIIDKYSGYVSNYNLAMKMMIEQYDAKITSVLENFTGDFIGSLSGIANIMAPDFAMAAGIVEGKENDVAALIEQAGFVKHSDGYYSIEVNNLNLYFAVNKNTAYLAGNPDAIAKFLDKGYSSDITSAKDFGRELKNASSYFYFNLNINDYPAILKAYLGMLPQGKMVMPWLEKLKSINGSTSATNDFEIKIKLNDSNYASKTLLKVIDEMAAEYFNNFE
jgi:hypothetical protein